MKTLGHLRIQELRLPPSQEWTDATRGWRLVRLAAGAAYWLGQPHVRALAEGELVVIAPGAKGVIRASQLNEVLLHGFSFCPDLLCGLLSLAERNYFDTCVAAGAAEIRFLPSTHPATARFAALTTGPAKPPGLFQSLEALEVVAAVFDDDIARHRPSARSSTSAAHRFQQLIANMPDTEIINHPPAHLARLCGCSPRHFSRLFRQHFGEAIRARQTELRLLKARQLLGATDGKIIEVALDSGYRNLSLFNSLFKRRFGMTPSEWRQKAAKKGGLMLALAAALALSITASARAQTTNTDEEAVAAQALRQRLDALAAEDNIIVPQPTNATPAVIEMETNEVSPSVFEALRAKIAELNGEEPPPRITTPFPTNPPTAAPTAAPSTNGPVFAVRGYELRGNTLLPRSVTEPILRPHVGPAVTFETIRQARADVLLAYRERGFVTVAVGLPQQQLTNGIVRFEITEGRLAEINVLHNRYFSSNNVMRDLPSLRKGIILNALIFQQELDHANANKDRQVSPVISPGPDPGTTILDLTVKDRLPLHGRIELDNYSTPDTPDLRLNLNGVYDNLWQLNHQFGVQYSFSPQQYKEGSYNFYDAPLIANYSAFYRLPLSGANGPTRDGSYNVGDFGFNEATRRFRPPAPSGACELLLFASRSSSDTGFLVQSNSLTPATLPPSGGLQVQEELSSRTLNPTEDIGGRISLPLSDARGIVSTLSGGLDWKNYRSTLYQDHAFSARLFVPAFGTNGPPWDPPNGFLSQKQHSTRTVFTEVQYLPVALNWEASVPDGSGSTVINLGESFNLSGILSGPEDFRAVTGSTHATGNYFVFTGGLTREQRIYENWGVRLHSDGQWANEPLVSTEQFSAGGQAGPRGYQDGAEFGDAGWRAQIEPHTPYYNLGLVFDKFPMITRLYAFTDYAERYLLDPGGRKGTVRMLGVGGGLDLSVGEYCDIRLTLGIPLLDTPGQAKDQLRATFSIGAQF